MIDLEIIKYAIEEVEKKSWGVTQQFLEIHELLYEDNKP
jgi:phenylpyruvate tautomerase PptA (4-oxalocrotonate tautomerase family)